MIGNRIVLAAVLAATASACASLTPAIRVLTTVKATLSFQPSYKTVILTLQDFEDDSADPMVEERATLTVWSTDINHVVTPLLDFVFEGDLTAQSLFTLRRTFKLTGDEVEWHATLHVEYASSTRTFEAHKAAGPNPLYMTLEG